MKNWGDGKKFLFEDIVVYSGVIICDLLYDVFANFLYAVNLRAAGIPYNFGYEQSFVFFAFLLLLVRKINQWRYYA